REMEGVPDGERTARFVCVMVLAGPLHLFPTSGTGVSPVRTRPNLKRRKRHFPHWERDGATYAITFRVAQGQLSELERRIVMDACLHWHGVRSRVDLVVVMPDHVHLLVHPHPKPNGTYWSLSELLHSIKSY